MPEFYLQTSAHLYGIIHRILRDEVRSSAAMQRLYGWIWSSRAALARQPSEALTLIRAEAHRYALDARTETQSTPSSISGQQDDLLRIAYLDCELPSDQKEGASEPDDVRSANLLKLLQALREERS